MKKLREHTAREDLCISHDFATENSHICKIENIEKIFKNEFLIPTALHHPFISILIPTYNRAHYISDAIASAMAQAYDNFEIVVVDDGSTDTTAQVVQSFNDPRLKYIVKEHSGAPATRNRCIVEARGEFILWLDSDDVLMPEVLQQYTKIIRDYPTVDVSYGDLEITDTQLNPTQSLKYPDWFGRNRELIALLFKQNAIPNPGTLVRKACYARIGGYDELYRRAHDYQWWVRLAKTGVFKHVGCEVAQWRWHDSNMSSGSVSFDVSFDARVVMEMLVNFNLSELVPDLDWSDNKLPEVEVTAWLLAAARFVDFDYSQGVQFCLKKACEITTTQNIIDIMEKLSLSQSISSQISNPALDKDSRPHCSDIASVRDSNSRTAINTSTQYVSPLVSVIVPTHNRPDMLKDTIQSILDQTFQDFEIIVINDAGQDVSSVVQSYNTNKIIYLSHATNKGLAATRNTGIRAARGKYIAYLDDDDIYYPEHLSTLVNILEKDNNAVAYTDAYRAFVDSYESRTVYKRDVPYNFDFDYNRIFYENFIPVLCVMHRKDCFNTVELFDPLLRRTEDWDLWIRMSQKFKFIHINKVTCEFRWCEGNSESMMNSFPEPFHWAGLNMYHKYIQYVSEKPEILKLYRDRLVAAAIHLIRALNEGICNQNLRPSSIFGSDNLEDICNQAIKLKDCYQSEEEILTQLNNSLIEYKDHYTRLQVGLKPHRIKTQEQTKCIAFHLPQFHSIPENDQWWGNGFTEWSNVSKASPRFAGHYQPHVPADLGYYNLADLNTLKNQASLAKEYGIHGFCFYHYWFNGKLLLETPLHQMLKSGEPDFPFCLCWANENWTRAWDGQNNDVLIGQNYSDADDIAHFNYLLDFFRDERYIRIDGKPLFLVYRANQIPDPAKTSHTWRQIARENGIGDIFLCRVESFTDEHYDPKMIGFDASVEFQPDWSMLGPNLSNPAFGDNYVFNYGDMVKRMLCKEKPAYTRFPCVTPSWDNSARRKNNATIIINSNPAIYELWLNETIKRVSSLPSEHKIVFINAWNEWGEGCHLEPDKQFGRCYLEATRSALLSASKEDSVPADDRQRHDTDQTTTLVSIIIPVFNQVRFTAHCLETLYANTPRELSFEVIVVDNASTDETTNFLSESVKLYPSLRVVTNSKNLMFSGGCNCGAQAAHGKYFIFLNNDTEPHTGWLEPLINMADADDSIGVIGSKLVFPDDSIQHAGIVVGEISGEPYPYHVHLGEQSTHPSVNETRELQMVTGACLLIRADLFRRVGGFDENFINGHEDLDLCLKARKAGLRVVYCPASVVTHFESRTKQTMGMENFLYQKGVENEEGRGRRRFLEIWGSSLVIDDRLPPVRYCAPGILIPTEREKLKILFTMYGWNETGGGTIFPKSVTQELVRRGYEVAVFYASLKHDPLMPAYSLEITEDNGVALYGIYNRPALFTDPQNPEREIHDPDVLDKFQKVLDEVKPDLVHFNNFHGLTFAMAKETHRRGVPSCFTPHNYHLIDPDLYMFNRDLSLWDGVDLLKNSEAVKNNPTKKAWYLERAATTKKLLNEWVDITLAVSSRQREFLIQHGGQSDRIAVVHQANASTDALWENELLADETNRKVHNPLNVGFIGGVMPQKGVHMLVAAAQLFESSEAQFHVYGFAMPEYLSELKRIDRKNVVNFHGEYSQAQLATIAHDLDIAVVPSVWEDCAPLVVLELHAMRLPVIAARIGGITDFITEGIDGLLYDPFDLESLINSIRTCHDNPSFVMGMRRNLVVPTHTFGRYMSHLEKVYAALISGQIPDLTALPLIINQRNAISAAKPVSISWHGGLFVHHSLALVNRELCLKLMEQGCDISFVPTQPDEFSIPAGDRLQPLELCRNQPLSRPDVTVRHQWPPDFSPVAAGKLVVILPWEFGSAPAEWVKGINRNVDQVWVPSSFVRDCYLQSGVIAEKVQVIPNGVALEQFHPDVTPCTLQTSKKFRFLFVGGTIHRKGIDILLAAYSQSFTVDDDVCLVIKDMGGNNLYQGQTAEKAIAAFRRVPTHPEIIYLDEMYDNAQMAALYTACHCLVHPYRGEGFGLPIAEGMACGLAPIVTDYGAALDFCPPEIAWLIPAQKIFLSEKKIGNLETVDFPWLAEPDMDALAALMRHAFENLDQVKTRGIEAARHIRENFSWIHAAGVAVKCLQFLTKPAAGVATINPVHNLSEKNVLSTSLHLVCMRAEKLAQLGEIGAAVQLLRNEGIQADPDSPIPYIALAEILIAAQRYDETLAVIAKMPPGTDQSARWTFEARCQCALGNEDQARRTATEAGKHPQALVVLGTLAARNGDMALGESLFRQSIALDETCGEAWLSLGVLLWGKSDNDGAWNASRQAVLANPLNKQAVDLFRDMTERLS